jgi:hypothetical protein
MTRYGTHHFVGIHSAIAYYLPQYDVIKRFEMQLIVQEKLKNEEIKLGPPPFDSATQTLLIIEGRYHIEDKP